MAATYKILNRFFRRSISASTYFTTLSYAREYHLLINPIIPNPTSSIPSHLPRPYSFGGPLGFVNSRTISTRSQHDSEFGEASGFDIESITESPELVTQSNVVNATLAISGEESIFPIRVVVSVLDGFHELSSLPWCVTFSYFYSFIFPLLFF